MLPINGISPWVQGQTSPTWTITLQRVHAQGVIATFDLTNVLTSQISILIYNQAQSSVLATGTGTLVITNASLGIITYKPASTDSSNLTPGTYYIRVKVLFNGTDPDFTDFCPWTIQA